MAISWTAKLIILPAEGSIWAPIAFMFVERITTENERSKTMASNGTGMAMSNQEISRQRHRRSRSGVRRGLKEWCSSQESNRDIPYLTTHKKRGKCVGLFQSTWKRKRRMQNLPHSLPFELSRHVVFIRSKTGHELLESSTLDIFCHHADNALVGVTVPAWAQTR